MAENDKRKTGQNRSKPIVHGTLEKDIEAYLVSQVRKQGGLCWKFTSPGTKGVPDRLCILAGQMFFVELKRPGARRRHDEKVQDYRAMQLRDQGCKVYKVSSKAAVDLLVRHAAIGHLPKESYIEKL